MARPSKFREEEHPQQIMRMASLGMPLENIGYVLGITDSTMDEWVKKPEVIGLYKEGKNIGYNKAAGKLQELIDQGHAASIFFYLKTQWRWQEVQRVEHSGEVRTSARPNRKGDRKKRTAQELEAQLLEEVEVAQEDSEQ